MRTAQRAWIGLLLLLGSGRDSQAETVLPDCGSDAACAPLYDRAKQASGENNLPDALRFYKLAYEVRADPRLLFNIARVLHKLDRTQEAISYYKQFLDSPLEDAEQKLKAEQYLEQIRTGSASSSSKPPLPTTNPSPLSAQAQKEPRISSEASPSGRPRWRLVVGGVAIGAGLLLTAFGASALAAQGKCVDLPSSPAQTCDRIYTTTPVGGALLGTGAAAVVGGVVLMAWPGR